MCTTKVCAVSSENSAQRQIASGDGGPAINAEVNGVAGVAVDVAGNLYLAQSPGVRKITADGIINTVAGAPSSGFGGDGGPATSSQLDLPMGVAIDASGNLYIATVNRIRKVTREGMITTIAGTGALGRGGDGGPAIAAELRGP